MKITFTFLFSLLTFISIYGQGGCNPPGADNCESSNVLCTLDELDGYSCSNPDADNPTGSNPLCFGVGKPHNTVWWAFIGGGNTITLSFNYDSADCKNYNDSNTCVVGIQAGVLGECGDAPVACNASCCVEVFELRFFAEFCKVYYVWVDGCNADVCNYTMGVSPKGHGAYIPEPLPDFYVVGKPCKCGVIDVCVEPLANNCEVALRWTIDGVPAPDWDDQLCVTGFDVPTDPVEFCVTWIMGNPSNPNGICDEKTKCFTITPEPSKEVTLPPEWVCYEDHQNNYQWRHLGYDTIIESSCVDPPCRLSIPDGDGCCIDYYKEINLLPEREVGEKWVFVCDKTPFVAENGKAYRKPACDVEVKWKEPWGDNGTLCDTSYRLFFDSYDPKVKTGHSCGKCQGYYDVTAEFDWTPTCIRGSYEETPFWIDPNGDTIWEQDFEVHLQDGDPPGRYEFVIKVDYTDPDDPDQDKTCYYESGKFEIILPVSVPAPVLAGDSPLCFGSEGDYHITNDINGACQYNWYVKEGNGVILTKNIETAKDVRVLWNHSPGNTGIICVNALVNCGTSKDSCFVVELLDAPDPDAGPDTVLCGLTYTMQGNIDVPGGMWTLLDNPGNATFDAGDIHTEVSVDAYGEYVFEWSEHLSTCDGSDSIRILFRPDPKNGPVDTICAGDAESYRVQFEILDGEEPYEIVSGNGTISGNIFLSDSMTENVNHQIVIKDKYGCTFMYEINYDCACHNQLGIISKDTIKECGATQVSIQYDHSGEMLGPKDVIDYVLFDDPNDYYGSSYAHNSTGTFVFDPNTMIFGKVYYLGVVLGKGKADGTVDELGGCLQKALQPVIWYEIPTPEAGPEESLCGLEIDLTGTPSVNGSSIHWINTPGVIMEHRDSTSTHIMATDYGRYVFYFMETNAICDGLDSVVVHFNESPEIINLRKICLDRDPEFKWYYEVCITKGKPVYTKIKGNGTLDNSTWCFKSNNLQSSTTDTLVVQDINGCEAMIPVSFNCDCGNTAAGTMDPAEQFTCVDNCITVMANNDHMTQADDCVKMILHSDNGFINPSDPVLVIQDYNVNGNTFCFDATTMMPNKVYYVSYVVGECTATGELNLNDFCLRLVSKPVRFVPYPMPDAGPDKDICFLTTTLEAQSSLGTGMWTVLSKPSGTTNVVIADPTSSGSPISVDEYGKYVLVWTENNEGCSATDTVEFVFHDYPLWRNVTFECDSVAEHYKMRFEVYGGDNASYALNGTVSGFKSLGGGRYETPWINQGNPVSVSATDAFACQPAVIDTSYQCDCITSPGEITADDIMCSDETTTASYALGTLDPNDGIMFVLHDGDATTIGNRIAVNTTGVFSFNSTTMSLNKTYFITAVVGNKKPDGTVNEADRCAANTTGIPVTWYDDPEALISPDANTLTCLVEVIGLDGSVSKNRAGTGSLQYQWSTSDGAFESGADLNAAKVNIVAPGTYKLKIVNSLTGCEVATSVVIDEDKLPPLAKADALGCDAGGMRIDASGSSRGNNFVLEWSGAGLQPNEINKTDPVVNRSGWYTVKVTNTKTGCVNYDSVEVILLENFEGIDKNITCYGEHDGQLFIQGIKGGNKPIRYSVNGEAPKPYNGPVHLTQLGPGTYTLKVIDSKGCELSQTVEIIEPDPIDIFAKESFFKEWGDDLAIDTSLIEEIVGVDPKDASIEWYDETGKKVTNTVLKNLTKSKYTFKVVLRDTNGCIAEDYIDVFVKVTRKVYIPNTINPQSALNDNNKLYVFGRPGLVDKVNIFRVYDRWGELVWQNNGPIGFDDQGRSLVGWDATFKAQPVKPGVYVYYAEVAFKDLGEGVVTKKLSGDVTVIR